MKTRHLLESFCVPLALAGLGYGAVPLAMRFIQLLGLQHGAVRIDTIARAVLMAVVCGLAAGIVAVAVQKQKAARERWAFYGLLALSVPIGAGLVFAIEAVRMHFGGAFGYPAQQLDIASVPLWILAAGFWVPFLLLLRNRRAETVAPERRQLGRDAA